MSLRFCDWLGSKPSFASSPVIMRAFGLGGCARDSLALNNGPGRRV